MDDQKTFVELFCGKGIVTKVFRENGYSTFSTDIRKRINICEPDIQIDIMQLQRSWIPFKHVNTLFAAIPCTAFSYGAGDHYYDEHKQPKETAKQFLSIMQRTLVLIEEINPDIYFIENPRGRLRYNKTMIDFLIRTNGMIKEITLGSYGFQTIKPTDIFTNLHSFKGREQMKYGRGQKNPSLKQLGSLTQCTKQETPLQLAEDIYNAVTCSEKVY